MDGKKILFFDGVCNLCNSFVNYTIDHNAEGDLLFAPLQSAVAEKLIPEQKSILEKNPEEASVVYFKNGRVFLHSKAVFEVTKDLKGIVRVLRIFSVLPAWFTDFFYRWVAKNRYRWFGKKETCRMPTPDLKKRFLE